MSWKPEPQTYEQAIHEIHHLDALVDTLRSENDKLLQRALEAEAMLDQCVGDGTGEVILAMRSWIEECCYSVLYPIAHEETEIGKRAEIFGAATVELLTPNGEVERPGGGMAAGGSRSNDGLGGE